MFLLSDDTIELTPFERDAAKAFVESPTGRRFLSALLALRPAPLLKGTSEEICCATGNFHGYELAITTLLELSRSIPNADSEQKPEQYPEIEDDKLWPGEPTNPSIPATPEQAASTQL